MNSKRSSHCARPRSSSATSPSQASVSPGTISNARFGFLAIFCFFAIIYLQRQVRFSCFFVVFLYAPQRQFFCCGTNLFNTGFEDWKHIYGRENNSVPDSCCQRFWSNILSSNPCFHIQGVGSLRCRCLGIGSSKPGDTDDDDDDDDGDNLR